MMSGSTSAHQLFITPQVMRLLLTLCPLLKPVTSANSTSPPCKMKLNDALPTVPLIKGI